MRFILIATVLLAISGYALSKKFTRCEVAKYLFDSGIPKADIPRIVCAAEKSTDLESNTITRDWGGVRRYGIFQSNDAEWCQRETRRIQPRNKCNLQCSKLIDDDLTDDARCMYWRNYSGNLNKWFNWRITCAKVNDKSYLGKDCQLEHYDPDFTTDDLTIGFTLSPDDW